MSEPSPEPFDLAQELRELMQQLKEAVRVAREHPQTKEFERQISLAVTELTAQIDRAVRVAKEDEHVRHVESQVKETAEAIKAGQAKEQVEQGLAKGVRSLNEQIRRAVKEADEAARDARKPPAA